jgi:hypothetical protein
MGRRRPSWSGRGKAKRRLTGQRVVFDVVVVDRDDDELLEGAPLKLSLSSISP